jgi:hypothetical protein
MSIVIFWIMTLCNHVGGYQHFRHVRITTILGVVMKLIIRLHIALAPNKVCLKF